MSSQTVGPPGPVLVTGANGYVASWLVKRLLQLGFDVHGTVRDPLDPVRTGHLRTLARGCSGSLSLFRADLLDPDGWDHVGLWAGLPHRLPPHHARCRGSGARPREAGHQRHRARAGGCQPDEHHQPYSLSKTLAERLAWRIAGEQTRWDLVVVNPGLVLGPGLSRHTNAEGVLIIRDFGNGYYQYGAPELKLAIVDVRDVAEGHLRAGLIAEASGRHVLVSETLSLIEIASILRARFGDGHPFPRRTVSRPVALMLAPKRGIPQAVAKRNIGYPLKFDNSYAREALGVTFRPAAESIVDHFQQLLDDGLIAGSRPSRSDIHRSSRC